MTSNVHRLNFKAENFRKSLTSDTRVDGDDSSNDQRKSETTVWPSTCWFSLTWKQTTWWRRTVHQLIWNETRELKCVKQPATPRGNTRWRTRLWLRRTHTLCVRCANYNHEPEPSGVTERSQAWWGWSSDNHTWHQKEQFVNNLQWLRLISYLMHQTPKQNHASNLTTISYLLIFPFFSVRKKKQFL